MKHSTSISLILLAAAGTPAYSQDNPPAWAYPVNPPNFQRSPDDGTVRRVPDSTAGFTLTQVRDLFAAPDWHPEDHPPMPQIVATGRKPDVFACGVCHRADGPGGPENASLFGLSAEYILQQTVEFKTGLRTNSAPRVATDLMVKASKAVTDQELKEAADYFASIKPRANIGVVEPTPSRRHRSGTCSWRRRAAARRNPSASVSSKFRKTSNTLSAGIRTRVSSPMSRLGASRQVGRWRRKAISASNALPVTEPT